MQTLKKFNLIKKKCDKIIRNTDNVYLVSNNSLNIIKGHPFHLSLFSGSLFYYFKKFILSFIKLLIGLFQNKKTTSENKKNFKLLLISNLLSLKYLNQNDYVFGNLENELKKYDISFHKILVNHTNCSNDHILRQIKKRKNVSIIDFNNQNIFENLKLTFKLIGFFLLYIFKGIKNLSLINFIFALDFLNNSTKKNLSMLNNFKINTKNLSYKNLLMPYEGYSWERLILMQAHFQKSKKRIGYHFSGISKHQHSIFRKLKKEFQPDLIFTTGKYSNRKFKKKINIPVKSIGSVRSFSVRKKNLIKKKYDFCVLPEGILSECKKLFLFSLECARLNPAKSFVWRLHPTMNFEFVLRKIKIDKSKLPNNIFLSKNDFLKDISNSKFCIYRGSTSVITAIQIGVYPIYYNGNEQINIDPIFDFRFWKTIINTSSDLNNFIKYLSKKVNKKINGKTKARQFGENYFQKMNTKSLINELKN